MKSKKYILSACAAIALLFAPSSCSDSFLDETPYSKYAPGDLGSVESYLQGLHYMYAQIWSWSSSQGFLSCWQLGTDVASAGATEGVEVPFYQYAELNAENKAVEYLWRKCYQIINNANMIIELVEGNPEYAAAAGEARFFRAYMYNTLVTLWGDVPFLDKAVTAETGARTDYTREKVSVIDELIESDLVFASQNLPEDGVTESRINKYMAMHALGEVYLRMGMRDAQYFAKAEAAVTPIIENTSRFSLIQARYGDLPEGDYFRDMFVWGNQRRSQGNTEAIWTFEMEYNRDVIGGTIDNPQHRRVWVPGYHKIEGMVNADSIGGRGNGRMLLSNFIKYGLYEDGDIRNSNYNIKRVMYYNRPDWSGEVFIDPATGWQVYESDVPGAVKRSVKTGDRYIPFAADSTEVFGPYTLKWACYDELDDFGYAGVKDWPIMRLGETYLLRAEARFRQNDLTGAAADINVLRDRAFKEVRAETGNTTLGAVSASDITLDFILDERARELIGEENRRMTLVRTGTLLERAKLNTDRAKPITGLEEKHLLLPIPLTEKQLNKDADLGQNPGY